MAGLRARPAGRGLAVVELQHPAARAVGHAVAHVVLLLRRMHLVAGAAGAAAARLLQVQVVQVGVAVAEARQRRRLCRGERRLLVAREAQRIGARVVGRVELRRVVVLQQAEVVAAVRLVAGAAVLGGDRAVPDLVGASQALVFCSFLPLASTMVSLLWQLTHRSNGCWTSSLATELPCGSWQLAHCAPVVSALCGTARIAGQLGDVVVAARAQRARLVQQQLALLRVVRVVAAGAGLRLPARARAAASARRRTPHGSRGTARGLSW